MAKQRYTASVTFESETGAPETHRQEIHAASHQKAASEAVRAAKRMLPGRRPTSIVVLLEPQGVDAHDPLCSEGQHAGDQTMPCDCDPPR